MKRRVNAGFGGILEVLMISCDAAVWLPPTERQRRVSTPGLLLFSLEINVTLFYLVPCDAVSVLTLTDSCSAYEFTNKSSNQHQSRHSPRALRGRVFLTTA